MVQTTRMMATAAAPSGLIQGMPSGTNYQVDVNSQVQANALDIVQLLTLGFVFPPDTLGKDNFVATVDPTVNNDTTQGYAVGSIWFNQTNGRCWMCMSSVAATAVWAIDAVNPGVGSDPSNMITAFGAGTNVFTEEGNIYRGISGAGIGNTADANDDILFGYQLSANSFDLAGRGLCITAMGKFAANANANKQAKILIGVTLVGSTVTAGVITGGNATGGTLIGDTGAAASNNLGWQLMTTFFKYGANGANTQYAQYTPVVGTTHGGVSLTLLATLTESGVINVVCTGKAGTSAANDVVGNFFEINAMN